MDLEELKEAVETFFSDTSRDKADTADGLRDVANMCNERAAAIDFDLE